MSVHVVDLSDPPLDHRGSFTRIDVGFDDLVPLPECTDIAATDAKVVCRDFGSFPCGSKVPNGSTRTVTVSPPRSSHTADADVVTRAMYTVSTSTVVSSFPEVPGTTDPAGTRQNTPSRNLLPTKHLKSF